MEDNNLSLALRNSISEEATNSLTEIAEIGLDSVLDDGLLKDIPVISTAFSLYKIGRSVKERHYVKKLAQFVCALNNGAVDEESREYYKRKLEGNDMQRNQELEYIMVLIDRYISYDKPDMLAKLYLAYLREDILWQEFAMYAEVIDRFLPGDYEQLCRSHRFTTVKDLNTEVLLRLAGLGLVIESIRGATSKMEGSTLFIDPPEIMELRERNYYRTEFGERLVAILNSTGTITLSD